MDKLTVVIPVYNEEEVIEEVINDWNDHLKALDIEYTIKIYNDGSKDNTLAKLNEIQSRLGSQIVVVDKANSGHGPTVLKSYLDSLDTDWLFQVDSDNEIAASYFKDFWHHRKEVDLVIGRRLGRQSPAFRKLMTAGSAFLVKVLYGAGIPDVNVPYRLMRVSAFKSHLQRINKDVFVPNIIVSGIAAKYKMRIKILDIEYVYRTTGVSTLDSNVGKLLKISQRCIADVVKFVFQK
jgi:glycosyltransferase involved in cell wall biosynthesis